MEEKSFRDSIKVYKPNDQQQARLYDRFITQQESQFELYINYINEILCTLKHYRIVSDFTEFNARIKSLQSAIENDGEKTLDDVFGIEIDFGTPREKAFVSEIIKGTLNIRRERIHNNDNGYVASHAVGYPTNKRGLVETFEELLDRKINPEEEYLKYYNSLPQKKQERIDDKRKSVIIKHFRETKKSFESYAKAIKLRLNEKYMEQLKEKLMSIECRYISMKNTQAYDNVTIGIMGRGEFHTKNDPNIPAIEFQSKTVQVNVDANIGTARHDTIYKESDSGITQEEYDRLNGKIPLSKIPTMYSSDLKVDEKGRPIPPRLLSSDETLRKLNPDLITNTDEIERGEM